MPLPSSRMVPATSGLNPALIIIGIMMVPTRMNMPSPLDAAKIIEVTIKNAYAIGSGLSPAISAALRIIVLVMPTRLSTLPKNPPKNRPAIAVLILMAPASRTSFAILNSPPINGMPAISAIPTAIIGSARMVGSFLVIIRTTINTNNPSIPIT